MKILKIKKGFSLLELMLVLGIIAAIIISAFMIYPKARDSVRSNNESKNIITLKNSIISIYSGKGYYDNGLSSAVLFRSILPSNVNQWGGTIKLTGQMAQEANNYQGFAIITDNISQDGCIKIASSLKNNFTRITINDTTLVVNPNPFYPLVDFNIATAASACSEKSEIQLDYFG